MYVDFIKKIEDAGGKILKIKTDGVYTDKKIDEFEKVKEVYIDGEIVRDKYFDIILFKNKTFYLTTQEDIDEFIRLGKDLKSANKGFDITFSFSTFVPKPHTPFQWCGKESIKSLKIKENYLKKEFHKIGIKSKFSSPKWDYYQAVLSRGDSSLTDYLIEVYKQGAKLGAYKSAAKKYNINTDKFAEGNLDINQELPWDFILLNPGKEFLKKEYERLINV